MIVSVADYWVYPFLKVMPPPLISVFFAACFFATLGIYFLGQLVGHWRWRGQCVFSVTWHICVFIASLFYCLKAWFMYIRFYILCPCAERHLLIEELRL